VCDAAGVSAGHTGLVRLLISAEVGVGGGGVGGGWTGDRRASVCSRMLAISGGDGFSDWSGTDDPAPSPASVAAVGRDDHASHLLLWQL
jgi:hypothetical protein